MFRAATNENKAAELFRAAEMVRSSRVTSLNDLSIGQCKQYKTGNQLTKFLQCSADQIMD